MTVTVPQLLTISDLMELLHIRKTAAYEVVKAKAFPKPIRVGSLRRCARSKSCAPTARARPPNTSSSASTPATRSWSSPVRSVAGSTRTTSGAS